MNSLSEAFHRARRHTRAEKRLIISKPKPPKEDYSDLMDEAFLHDIQLSGDFDRLFDLCQHARPISVCFKPGPRPKRFA